MRFTNFLVATFWTRRFHSGSVCTVPIEAKKSRLVLKSRLVVAAEDGIGHVMHKNKKTPFSQKNLLLKLPRFFPDCLYDKKARQFQSKSFIVFALVNERKHLSLVKAKNIAYNLCQNSPRCHFWWPGVSMETHAIEYLFFNKGLKSIRISFCSFFQCDYETNP